MSTVQAVSRFTEFPFSEGIQEDLASAGYETPTPIQAEAIGPALGGEDLIGLAQTGTGKTAAFALPIIHRLHHRMDLGALVLAPTRELAHQIVGVFRELGRTVGIRVASIVGGTPMEDDWKALRSWPNVLVATPGRLIDHLEQKTVSLKEIEVFVIDEADRMHDMGFIPQIRRIIGHLPDVRQTMMFTATMPSDVERIVRQNMRDPVKIQVGPASRPVERAEQTLFSIQEAAKTPVLLELLKREEGRVLVFVRTKRGAERLARQVGRRFPRVARLHGDREQAERDEAMHGFRGGRFRILIATDIAARGLDVADIDHVINYDFPHAPEDYIHRIGRTARLEASGRATSFVTPADRKYFRALERLLGTPVPLVPAPGGGAAEVAAGPSRPGRHAPASAGGQGRRKQGRGGRGRRPGGPATARAASESAEPAQAAPPPAPRTPPSTATPRQGPSPDASQGAPPAAAPGKRRRRRGRRGRGGRTPEAGASAGAPGSPPSERPPQDAPAQDRQAPPEQGPPPEEDLPPYREPTVIEWD